MSFIRFAEGAPRPKTRYWNVIATHGDPPHPRIGSVAWYGPWHGYEFFPCPQTVFEQKCLRDIADFCEERTREHRARRAHENHG